MALGCTHTLKLCPPPHHVPSFRTQFHSTAILLRTPFAGAPLSSAVSSLVKSEIEVLLCCGLLHSHSVCDAFFLGV